MSDDKKLIIVLGSNYHPMQHIRHAEIMLKEHFPDIIFSAHLRTKPIGIASPHFDNPLAVSSAKGGLEDTLRDIKRIEHSCGDTMQQRKNGVIVIDIDLLRFGDKKLHKDDWERPYIRQLLEEMNLI